MAMGYVFDNFTVNMLGELYRSLCSTGGAYSAAFAGERDKERVLTAVAVYPSSPVSEDSAVKVLCQGPGDLVSQAPVLMLEPGFPDVLEFIVRVEDYLIQRRGFRFTLFVVLELFLVALPCVSPKHIHEEIVKVGAKVILVSVS
jgi:hypothetical protein